MTSLGVSLELGEAVVWVGLFLACFRDGREKQRRARELGREGGEGREGERRAGGASRRHCSASCSRRDETPLSKTRGRSALVREQQREVIALQKQLALLGCTPPAASAASAVAANSPASAPEGYNTSPPGAGEGGGEGASSHHRPSASTPFLV
ncbi:hypothetical protein EMIHUDRAFT_357198 [Emiliania huxleyi CCMP1516]|uniref:Uncharacterized protein n=2 Tax=Emiliania huxleyi TaxID=2903 RepID=A0A0D3INV9_EMIH1|nr:hypothetical protein EMIHUDRAFT_357198 [Emiliania huxleyi CCMP1516]EOD12944.1 hypothetical protein EMIHUDRAFT_357198 [Emiliania huxleyi CCMP1516]|eukprot:XP_005765373.1 hypothetical protein EMIHUDRAFT_357198 [Emiliania huxleyi CCMP1516]